MDIEIWVMYVSTGRAASGGALAPEPQRATRNTPEADGICPHKLFFLNMLEFSLCRLLGLLGKIKTSSVR
jgi:hypothetical protein